MKQYVNKTREGNKKVPLPVV